MRFKCYFLEKIRFILKMDLENTLTVSKMRSFGSIAQWIEHPPSKRVVAGSNPARSDLKILWQRKKSNAHKS